MQIPFVHWLPKRNIRKLAIGLFLFLGIGKDYFSEFGLKDRSTILYRYSTDQTFYRSNSSIARCFEYFGMRCEITEAVRTHLAIKLRTKGRLALRVSILRHLLIAVYANFWSLRIYCWRQAAR